MKFFCPNCHQGTEDPNVTTLGTGTAAVCDKCGLTAALVVFRPDAYQMLLRTKDLIMAYNALLEMARKIVDEGEAL